MIVQAPYQRNRSPKAHWMRVPWMTACGQKLDSQWRWMDSHSPWVPHESARLAYCKTCFPTMPPDKGGKWEG